MFDTNLTYNQPTSRPEQTANFREMNRLLSAAIVSSGFRNMLITSPETAIAKGYQGEKFNLTNDEYSWLVSIQAIDLASLASHMLEYQNQRLSTRELSIAVKLPDLANVS